MSLVTVEPKIKRGIIRDRIAVTSNHAAAYAAKDAEVDVVAAYPPITPQTPGCREDRGLHSKWRDER